MAFNLDNVVNIGTSITFNYVQVYRTESNDEDSVETFTANFAMILVQLISEGKVTHEYVNTLKTYFKVEQIWDISDEQKAEMFGNFVEHKLIVKVG